jgi:hypothetical protein
MKTLVPAILFFLASTAGVFAQNILVLEKQDFKKSFKYFQGDKIDLRTADSVNLKGQITAIKDTVIMLNFYTEVKLNNIAQVNRPRWLVNILSRVLIIGGAGLILIEAANGILNERGTMNEVVLYGGVAAVAVGALSIPFDKAKYPIAPDKWRLKILTADKEFNYQKNKPITF